MLKTRTRALPALAGAIAAGFASDGENVQVTAAQLAEQMARDALETTSAAAAPNVKQK
jgi:hypothetical protein